MFVHSQDINIIMNMNIELQIEHLIQKLFNNSEFSLLLQQKIANVLQQKRELATEYNQPSKNISHLLQQVNETIGNLIQMNLKEVINSDFSILSEGILEFKTQLAAVKKSLNDKIRFQDQLISANKRSVDDIKKKLELKISADRIEGEQKTRTIIRHQAQVIDFTEKTATFKLNQQITLLKEDIKNLKKQLQQYQKQLLDKPNTNNKLFEETSINLKTKIEQNFQILKRQIHSIGNKNQNYQKQLENSEKIQKIVKMIVEAKLRETKQTVTAHKQFIENYQNQFKNFQNQSRGYLQSSLQSVWKMVTDIHQKVQNITFELESYKKQEPQEQKKKDSKYSFF